MNSDGFWKIIESAKQAAGSDTEARVDALRSVLGKLTPADLQAFQNHYDQQIQAAYRWDLWAAAYIINGGCSDDGFRYFRDWLISEGRPVFEAALKDPDSLADLRRVDPAELESFGYVVVELYEQKGAGKLKHEFPVDAAEPA
ncbi:MAG: DUF4240 domain-containing protein, partial [Rhizomicrobium sp.]